MNTPDFPTSPTAPTRRVRPFAVVVVAAAAIATLAFASTEPAFAAAKATVKQSPPSSAPAIVVATVTTSTLAPASAATPPASASAPAAAATPAVPPAGAVAAGATVATLAPSDPRCVNKLVILAQLERQKAKVLTQLARTDVRRRRAEVAGRGQLASTLNGVVDDDEARLATIETEIALLQAQCPAAPRRPGGR